MHVHVLRFLLILACIISLGMPLAQANSMTPEEEFQARSPEQTFGYAWMVGSNFQPRMSSTSYDYAGGGCLYQDSGSPAWFTMDTQLPDGAEIIGLRYYAYDGSPTADSELALVVYDGKGNVTDTLNLVSEGSVGYSSFYTSTATPFVVNTAQHSLALLWQPGVTNSSMRLCAARIFFRYPTDPTLHGLTTEHVFYAASTFNRRESSISYVYGGSGCLYSPSGGTFTLDVNIPQGAALQDMTVYYYDNSANSVQAFASVYDGQGAGSNVISWSSEGAVAGYREATIPLSPALTIDEAEQGLVVSFLPGFDPDSVVCGIRVGYTFPVRRQPVTNHIGTTYYNSTQIHPQLAFEYTGESPDSYRPLAQTISTPTQGRVHFETFIAGSTFQPRSDDVAFVYRGNGCISATNSQDFFQADLQLPEGALIEGMWHLYNDQSLNDAVLNLSFFDGSGDYSIVAQVQSGAANVDGYGVTFVAATHAVDYFDGGYALVWAPLVTDPNLQLCGVRIRYSLLLATPVYLPMMRK